MKILNNFFKYFEKNSFNFIGILNQDNVAKSITTNEDSFDLLIVCGPTKSLQSIIRRILKSLIILVSSKSLEFNFSRLRLEP